MDRLVPFLWNSIAEMLAIDRFGSEKLELARRHLVVRRALFGVDSEVEGWPSIIHAGTFPTLADMLGTIAALDRPFFSALAALLDAGLPVDKLRSILSEGSVDLKALLDDAIRANEIDSRRPMISPNEIEQLRQIT